MTKEQVLQTATIEGKTIKLNAGILDRKIYMEVAKAMEGIGGKWKGGKIQAFVFDADPTERLAKIAGGEIVNLKKDFQFFASPADLADRMVNKANLNKKGLNILEPSAGQGAIVEAILRHDPVDCSVFMVEKMIDNIRILEKKFGQRRQVYLMHPLNDDFLNLDANTQFDRIIANPPFSKNQDIDHILKMYDLLAEQGRLVTISSPHWQYADDKKSKRFREFMEASGAEIDIMDHGTFKESRTNARSLLITIDK